MNWYERLNDYFPEHEMKDKGQLKDLIKEKEEYHKEETEDYLILYAEFPDFIFIDYLLVFPHTRGKGVGTKVLNKFKEKEKVMVLEVEPKDPDDPDTAKRIAFYTKNGFQRADKIKYVREDEHGQPYTMHILYWAPSHLSQEVIMENMEKACDEIHNYRSRKYYGRLLADPDEVLRWKQ